MMSERSPSTVDGESAPPLTAIDLQKSFEGDADTAVEIIRSISFSLAKGEIVSIVGPSGCGKTTLLNTICGLTPASGGAVLWYGRELNGVPQRVGYMLQKDLLFPWRTALDNVLLGLEIKGIEKRIRRDRARELLHRLGLDQFEGFYPSALSGGMRQRVALARTLAPNPEVLLLDEPFSALDFQTKILIERDTVRLVRGEGRSLLLITHDVEEAVSMSDRVLVLSHRPCKIVAEHRIDLPIDRTDMIEARETPQFAHYVRSIWTQLDIR
jgi:NitT/TauT family transport system ATP-binding protein